MNFELSNKGYQALAEEQDAAFQEQQVNTDENDDDDLPPPYPHDMSAFEGYPTVGFCNPVPDDDVVAPVQIDLNQPKPTFQEVPNFSEEEAREALAKYVSEQCCYDGSVIKEFNFTELKSSFTYQYILETFTETRSTKFYYQPYSGQALIRDGNQRKAPKPWDVQVEPLAMFKDDVRHIEIPNTSHVEMCMKCNNSGKKYCYTCSGRGRKGCSNCSGSGFRYNKYEKMRESCHKCNGSGFQRCFKCDGTGQLVCRICKGTGRLKWFLRLTVKFKNHQNMFFKKSEQIPDEMLLDCKSKNIFSDHNLRVVAIKDFRDPEINSASENFIRDHLTRFSNTRILHQKHVINAIPVTLCKYKLQEDSYGYYVFGQDSQVYMLEYPRTCLCCSIL